MKNIIFLLSVLLSLNAPAQKAALSDSALRDIVFDKIDGYEKPNIALKNFSAVADDGKTYTNENLKGKATFINFWFEDCPPCRAEFDALNDFYKKYRNDKGFQFLSFSYESNENIARIKKKYHMEYPVIHMERKPLHDFIFGLGFPTNMVIDQSGKISFISCGGPLDAKQVKEGFESTYKKQLEKVLYPQ